MAYALRTPSGPAELFPGQPLASGDVRFSYETMSLWSDAERAAASIFPIAEPDPVPAGKVATGSTLSDDGVVIRRAWTLIDAPVTGNQWAFALSDLGLSAAWEVGVQKSKPKDRVRIGLIARDTPLVASDPLLIRVAANAGQDSSGKPLIDVGTVFVRAQGMPT